MAIEQNQVVSIEYELTVDNKVIDSNLGAEPLVFMFGKGQLIGGLEDGIKDMNVGDKKEVLVQPADGYGEYNDEAIQEVPKEQFEGIDLAEGITLYGQGEDGSTVQVVVKEIGDQNVIIDFNHPLAGKELLFNVVISDIREASEDEVMSGVPAENQTDSCNTGCGCGSH